MMIQVKLTEKDAKTKKQMACSDREVYRMVDPLSITLRTNAGFIHTGGYPDFTLVVFDFDLNPEKKGYPHLIDSYDWFTRIEESNPFMKVLTPSFGMHVYYIFKKGFWYRNKAKLKTFDSNVVCDIRGHNGIVFAPETYFPEEKYTNKYTVMNKDYGKVIHERIEPILEIFGITINSETGTETKTTGSDSVQVRDENSDFFFQNHEEFMYCSLWNSLYEGIFKIEHKSYNGIPEYLIWRNLWLWIVHSGIPIEEAIHHLKRTQPTFNEEETRRQLKYVKFNYKPGKKIEYLLFTQFLSEVNIEELI